MKSWSICNWMLMARLPYKSFVSLSYEWCTWNMNISFEILLDAILCFCTFHSGYCSSNCFGDATQNHHNEPSIIQYSMNFLPSFSRNSEFCLFKMHVILKSAAANGSVLELWAQNIRHKVGVLCRIMAAGKSHLIKWYGKWCVFTSGTWHPWNNEDRTREREREKTFSLSLFHSWPK